MRLYSAILAISLIFDSTNANIAPLTSLSTTRGGATPPKRKDTKPSNIATDAAPTTSQVEAVLGDGGGIVGNQGPTTWWGIPLDRMPGLQADIDKLNGLLEVREGGARSEERSDEWKVLGLLGLVIVVSYDIILT